MSTTFKKLRKGDVVVAPNGVKLKFSHAVILSHDRVQIIGELPDEGMISFQVGWQDEFEVLVWR